MSHRPHDLAQDFPDRVAAIHALKESDAHFAKLVSEYEDINQEVYRAETNIAPTDSLHEGELRKKRMALKDQIAAILAATADT